MDFGEWLVFSDRREAGRALGVALSRFAGRDAVILALPRGGVPVAKEVALALNAPLDLAIARKVGHPLHPEYAIGAVSEDGIIALNESEAEMMDSGWLEREVARQAKVAKENRARFWGMRERVPISGKTVILVDDGVATGYTLLAAIRSVRADGAGHVVVAAPVAAATTQGRLAREADECVFLEAPDDFRAVGCYYRDFMPVEDAEVSRLLS